MRASWTGWVLGIIAALIVAFVSVSFAFSYSVSRDLARTEERVTAQQEKIANTRIRAISNEAEVRRVAVEWDQFKEWYKDDRRQNGQDHKEILAALEALKK